MTSGEERGDRGRADPAGCTGDEELAKTAGLTTALTEALRTRGVPDTRAMLTAEAGIAVFRVGFQRWVDATRPKDLQHLLRSSLDELRAVTAGA